MSDHFGTLYIKGLKIREEDGYNHKGSIIEIQETWEFHTVLLNLYCS